MGTTTNKHIATGMTIMIGKKIYRVESSVRVTVAKKNPFFKAKLKELSTDKIIEKNFRVDQPVKSVTLEEKKLEYLYFENKHYLFLDVEDFEKIRVAVDVVGEKADYLKEGVEVVAERYGDVVFSIELPQFLEIMVVEIEGDDDDVFVSDTRKKAVIETGATVEVPQFIHVGDIIKIDTTTGEYIQRI